MKKRVGIIGKGSFGSALERAFLALVPTQISDLAAWEGHKNRPDWTPDILVLAIPSVARNGDRLAILDYIEQFPQAQVIVTSKGEMALQIFRKKIENTDTKRCFSLSGPNIADEIGRSPAATVLAGTDFSATESLAQILDGTSLHVTPSSSLEVVQRGGMLKNFCVFELGKIWDVLGTPMARFEATISALKLAFASIDKWAPPAEDRAEFFGLSGLGDLLLCLDIFPGAAGSRNFRAGKMIGAVSSISEVLQEFRTLEGLRLGTAFHTDDPPEFLRGMFAEEFLDLTLAPEKVSPQVSPEAAMLAEADALWEQYLGIAPSQNFLPNTHAWVACEIFALLAEQFEIDLSDFSASEKLLRAFLQAIFVPGIEVPLSAKQTQKHWKKLEERLPFLR